MRRRSMLLLSASMTGLAVLDHAGATPLAQAPTTRADAMFNQPYIDIDEWREAPVRHRYVHGGFKGTDARFSFYFPSKAQYQGRFFHYISPVPAPEDQVLEGFGATSAVAFAFDSGAYAVGTNQGGAGATASPGNHVDPTIAAYRVSAAAAEYSRQLAAKMYGPHRTYGYVYGGSGGAFRTIGGFENSSAWEGAVPFVMGSPMAIPNVYTVRMYATRLCKGKFDQIADALEPGGSGDIYAGLNAEQRSALLEATQLGLPPRAWWFQAQGTMGMGAFAILFDLVEMADPSYFTDFWTVPGYLGANPPPSLLADRVQHKTRVVRVIMSDQAAAAGLHAPSMDGRHASDADNAWKNQQRQMGGVFPVALELAEVPTTGDLRRAALKLTSGTSAGHTLPCGGFEGRYALLAFSPLTTLPKVAAAAQAGDEVEIDNSNFLAVQTYHRHQVPTPDYYVWDQFRKPDGTPIYPQRPRLLGPMFTLAASGVLPKARFKGKMIVVECLMDFDAFPWQADWYRRHVRENMGPAYEDQYRLWFVDHATHGEPPAGDTTHTVSYTPVLQQALRDLSAWVERGVAPPASTDYRMADGQVVVPPTAAERRGVQPVVAVTANGGESAQVKVGEAVTLTAVVETPPGTGRVIDAAWDYEGAGAYPVKAELASGPRERLVLKATHSFAKPGVYFPTLRAESQRQGNAGTPFARLPNLARARVVVS